MSETPETILNVNDNEAARYATTRILHRAGFKVLEASTGNEALQITREDLPPLVILDINLPDLNGVEVCRRIKTDPATSSTMVLQMSATNIAVIDRVNSLAAGADSFLVEPVEPEELEAVSRALLRLHRSEAALRRSLAERELLLKEVNHRVKNSLQLVLSMLSLQGHRFKEPETRELFTKAISRVTAIAAIHERLYQDQDPLTVEMHTYLTGLCGELVRASGMEENAQANLQIEVEQMRLPTEHGVAVALVVNELVMNALKHAQPVSGPAIISVRLLRHGSEQVRLTVADNGATAAQPPSEVAGLGTQLIRMLARQLNGTVGIERADGTYAVHVTFPLQSAVSWRQPY
jgi:two-component sensor histidine kinase